MKFKLTFRDILKQKLLQEGFLIKFHYKKDEFLINLTLPKSYRNKKLRNNPIKFFFAKKKFIHFF